MRKIKQSEFEKFITDNKTAIIVLTQENCVNCKTLKEFIIPKIQEKVPLTPFVEFQGASNVYPINKLSEKFNFKSVPAVVLFKNGIAQEAIAGLKDLKYYINKIQQL